MGDHIVFEIPLKDGKFVLVDEIDFPLVNSIKWYLAQDSKHKRRITNHFYAIGNDKNKTIIMHRLIMDAPKGLEVDHINGNGLDNRRSNLRIVTHAQNIWNSKKTGIGSKYKGIRYKKTHKKWEARMGYNGKMFLGLFDVEVDAAKAYDKAAKEKYGEYARLNFPEGVSI